MTYYAHIQTPAGELLLVGDGKTISGMHWTVFKRAPKVAADWVENKVVFGEVIKQLKEYFAGTRKTFDLTFAVTGTEFQQKVWQELTKIPYGRHTSYQAIATTIGKPKAVRAVGTAVGSNPLSIVVPCHRVLTSSAELGGYAGGLAGKRLLLKNEGIIWKDAIAL